MTSRARKVAALSGVVAFAWGILCLLRRKGGEPDVAFPEPVKPPPGGRPAPPVPLLPAPAGYKYASNLAEGAHAAAAPLLSEPYGTTRNVSASGVTYLARVEPHWDKGQTGVEHWHKGVSLFEPA